MDSLNGEDARSTLGDEDSMATYSTAGEFFGADGGVCELRTIRPKAHQNTTGNDVPSWGNDRFAYNWINKGGNSDGRPFKVATPFLPGRNGCVRCGAEWRNWRWRRLPCRERTRDPAQSRTPPRSGEKTMYTESAESPNQP